LSPELAQSLLEGQVALARQAPQVEEAVLAGDAPGKEVNSQAANKHRNRINI
jgi:hypothetical protein